MKNFIKINHAFAAKKTKIFIFLLAVAASVGTMFAERVQIGDLYYNLDGYYQTAEVAESGSASGDIIIPASVTYDEITYSVTSIGSSAFSYCTGLTSVTIPNSVTSIGDYAFSDCWGLTSVTIPNSVTSIGSSAFQFCTGLTSISVEEGNAVYDSRDNCNAIIETASNTLVAGFQNTTIPNSVTSIGDGAFSDCDHLTSVTIPNSVTSIGSSAFSYCYGLTSVTIPNSVTSIGSYAFCYCTGLTSVTIPNSVTYIGNNAFERCSGLTSLACEATTPPTLGNSVFSNVDKSIPLYVAQSVDLYKAADQWKDFTNILPIFTITFLNYDGSELQSSEVEAGTMPQYNGATPTRPADAQYTYTFAGWDKEIATVTANATYTATFEAIAGIGLFSVSATQQVTFAPGNLQYQASTNTWRFAEHQWDMVGMGYGQTNTDEECYIGGTVANSDNRNISSSYNGWIDLFGWGTGNAPTKLSGLYPLFFVDWGTNAISNGGNQANMWRTLTKDEWDYLFNTRANASSKYGVGMVNGINGMIVLPDEFTLPSGLTFTSGVHDSYGWQYYKEVNEYSAVEWARMEACGALFLPAAGNRYDSYVIAVTRVGDNGYYWSSTPYDTNLACLLHFDSGNKYWTNYVRDFGGSVRLAWAAQGEQEPVYSLSVSVEGEGTVTGAGEYKSGTTATLTVTAASGYTFSQWSDGSTDNPRTITMTQNLTLTAVFVKKTFLVSFLNYDGTELQSSEVNYGETPVYTGATPTKPADAQYTYSFSGWTPEVGTVTRDSIYTAVFEATLNKYSITWQDEDGNPIKVDEVAYGETPVFSGATPAKDATAEYTYEFAGWLPKISAVTKDISYTTFFERNKIEPTVYTVNINGENCSLRISNELPAGTKLQVEAVADECFEFQKWSDNNTDNPRTITVTEDSNLTAEFNKVTYTITGENENEGGEVQIIP